jgi:hypothetical protein
VGPDNLNPIVELKSLDRQIESVTDLAGLKPIFFRLEEIAKQNVNDFDVQLAVGDLKQHLVNRGTKLKEMKDAKPPAPAAPPAPPPIPPPLSAAPPPLGKPPSTPPSAGVPPAPAPPAMAGPPASPPPARTPEPLSMPGTPAPPPPIASPIPPVSGIPQSPQGPWATTENAPVSTPPPSASRPIPIPVKPPSAPAAKSPAAKRPVTKPAGTSGNWQRPVLIGAVLGVLLVAALVTGVVVHKRRLKQAAALTAAVQVQIATTPSGASVRVNGDPQCTSDCSLSLAPGNYQITAFLDGYEPAASGIAVSPGQPVTVNLPLEPQAQSLRILTDLDQGMVALDDQTPADLQEGQFIVDRVAPGQHTAKITSKVGEASFSFEIADAKPPSITGPVTTRNLNVVLVATLGTQAHMVTNNGPLKLAVNGQPEADAGPAGVDLKTFQSGVDELVIGDGKDQVSMKESFGPAPMLTAFLRSGVSTGTLIVSTGEDDVHVFLNNKDVGRRTQRGQIRIQTLGPVSVRVTKDGFDTPAVQTAEVKKGAETRLEFKFKASPQFATLQVVGGTPGAEVLVDQRIVGTVGFDGSFSNGAVAPGDHAIEFHRDQYTPRRLQRSFRAGQAVTISGSDAILAVIPVPVPPPPPPKPEPAPPPVVARKEPPPPAPKAGTMDDWEDPAAWKSDGGVWLHQGKGFIPYKLPPKGVFTFTVELVKGGGVFHGGKISWCLEYIDAKNYSLYEMDNKNFWAKVVSKGKTTERTHTQLKDLEKQKSFTIQIDVTPEHVVHKMFAGGEWVNLDSWAETGRNFSEGKFGFLIQGNDEIGLTDFKFQPK